MKKLATIALALVLANSAFAHSPVESTTPENGTTIAAIPTEIGFNFVNDIRLTRVDLAYPDQSSIRLDLGDQTSFAKEFTLPMDGMGDGTYRVDWRGLGADGHAMQGEFTFTVD